MDVTQTSTNNCINQSASETLLVLVENCDPL